MNTQRAVELRPLVVAANHREADRRAFRRSARLAEEMTARTQAGRLASIVRCPSCGQWVMRQALDEAQRKALNSRIRPAAHRHDDTTRRSA